MPAASAIPLLLSCRIMRRLPPQKKQSSHCEVQIRYRLYLFARLPAAHGCAAGTILLALLLPTLAGDASASRGARGSRRGVARANRCTAAGRGASAVSLEPGRLFRCLSSSSWRAQHRRECDRTATDMQPGHVVCVENLLSHVRRMRDRHFLLCHLRRHE